MTVQQLLKPSQAKLNKIKKLIKVTFDLDISDGQAEIVEAILDERKKRIWIATPTQYGKSLMIALAVLLLTAHRDCKLRIPIIAPSTSQSKIIMNYIISYVIKHPIFYRGLLEVEKVQRLQTEFTKDRLAWASGKEIRTLTANSGSNSQDINKAGSSLMGFGGDLMIEDEASLTPDIIQAKILRMLAGTPGSRLIMIGNPFNQNMFYDAYLDENYYHIHIDYNRAIAEGRFTQAFIDEMRSKISPEMFAILFEVKFVLGSKDSYITGADIETGSHIDCGDESAVPIKVGVDVARFGGDESVIVVRKGSRILRIVRLRQHSTMGVVGDLEVLHKEFNFDWYNVFIDSIGVGAGLVDRLQELNYDVKGVNVAESPMNTHLYFDMRTELWGVMKGGIVGGLKIEDKALVDQLVAPRYEFRYRSSGAVTKLEAKESMKRRGIKSPDIADALALSYYERKEYFLGISSYL